MVLAHWGVLGPDVGLTVAWFPIPAPLDLGRGSVACGRQSLPAAFASSGAPLVRELASARLDVDLPWRAVPAEPGLADSARDPPACLSGSRAGVSANVR
eukprot:5624542-Alexandrium_andersonii.AAC.1